MALIECKHCGQRISDRATACPYCKEPLNEKAIVCEECGAKLNKEDKSCPFCGCPVGKETSQPVEVVSVRAPKKKKKKGRKGLVIAVAVLIVTAAIAIPRYMKTKKAQAIDEYNAIMQETMVNMVDSAAIMEDCANLVMKVWYNAIYEKHDTETDKYTRNEYGFLDFNEALDNLYSSTSFSAKVEALSASELLLEDLMKLLNNPPEECKEANDILVEMYNAHKNLCSLVVSPTGSYTSYREDVDEAISEIIDCINLLELKFG